MAEGRRPSLFSFAFTAFMLGLISLATADVAEGFPYVMLVVVISVAFSFYFIFPGGTFFAISLANFLAVYACVFIFFTTTNFAMIDVWVAHVGFVLPIIAFQIGALIRRDSLRYIVRGHRLRDERHLSHTFVWLLPVGLIGAATFLVPEHVTTAEYGNKVFLASMGLIAVIVIFASRDVTTFLLDSALLFEEFFKSVASLLVPAFAFLTFYSMLVIVFACIYRIVDRYTLTYQFSVDGEPSTIGFTEALYFSVISVSTVGYGDILPLTDTVRILVAIQIILGVLLLLFGFSEIIAYARERIRDLQHGGRRR